MGINRVDLDLLRTFQAIYRSGTITGAAAALHVSQPAVTARLRALEAACATTFFDRTSRGCIPTTAAHDLARRCEAPLGELAAIASSLGCPTELRGTRLRLGAPAEYLAEQLAPALAGLSDTGMLISVTFGLADDLLAQLLHGDLDLVVSTIKPPDRTLWTTLADEEFVLVACASLAVDVQERIHGGDLSDALTGIPRITYDQQQSVTRRWWRHILGTPPPANPTITVPDLRAVRALVASGAGIGVLPTYLIDEALETGELVDLAPTDDAPINTLYLVTMTHLRHQPHVDTAWNALTGQTGVDRRAPSLSTETPYA